eukprot:5850334-Pyramimonas_sp.AAC.1
MSVSDFRCFDLVSQLSLAPAFPLGLQGTDRLSNLIDPCSWCVLGAGSGDVMMPPLFLDGALKPSRRDPPLPRAPVT